MTDQIHKIIDNGGAVYLPFALARVKALRALNLPNAEQKFIINRFEIRVSILGPQAYIYILSQPSYEFFCSDVGIISYSLSPTIPHNALLFTDSASLTALDAAITGCGVRTYGPAAAPAFSNTLPNTTSKTWQILPLPAGPMSAGVPVQTSFVTANAWQDQKESEYAWWYLNKPNILVTSCQGIGLGKSFQGSQGYLGGGLTGLYGTSSVSALFGNPNTPGQPDGRSIGVAEITGAGIFDIPPSIIRSGSVITAGVQPNNLAAFRRAAVQGVLVNGVTVYYFIASDHQGNFCCYQARDYSQDTGFTSVSNIPMTHVQYATPTYPSWVTVPTTTDTSPDHFVFNFNKDGTKAATIAYAKVQTYMWVAAENVMSTLAPPALDFQPRWANPYEDGDGGSYFPSWGIKFPVETNLTGETPYYTVTRQPVYRWTDGSNNPIRAVNVQGSYYQVLYGRVDYAGPGHSAQNVMPAETVGNYSLDYMCLPGLVELGFTIVVNDPTNLDNITFTVTVLQQEAYTVNQRFYLDCGYYASNKRTADQTAPAVDTLMTSEIEVWCLNPAGVVTSAQNSRNARPWAQTSNPTLTATNQVFTGSYNWTKADSANCEATFLSNYQGDVNVQYTVRSRVDNNIWQRFALVDNGKWYMTYLQVTNTANPFTLGVIRYADLRSLNFITQTYSLAPGNGVDIDNIGPRYELRMLGQPLRTINYGTTTAFGTTADPLTAQTPPVTYTQLTSTLGGFAGGTGAPYSFLQAMQLWASGLIVPGNEVSIPTHPNGHWSVYFQTHGSGRTKQGASTTEPDECFDYIVNYGKGETTHKAAFNDAFGQTRDYSAYKGLGEMGGFGTWGVWRP